MNFSSSIATEKRRDVTGMGDAIGMLPVCKAFEARGEQVTFFAEHRQKPFVELFMRHVRLIDEADPENPPTPFTTRTSNYADDITWPELSRLERFAQRMGVQPVLPVAPLDRVEFEIKVSEFKHSFKPKRPTVLLAPRCLDDNRAWPIAHFARLGEVLLEAGINAIVTGVPKDLGFQFGFCGILSYHTTPLEVAALISAADLLVSNDSGLAHLAGIMGERALALCGPTVGKQVFGSYPSVSTIQAPLACTGCNFQKEKAWTWACKMGCEALTALRPGFVAAQVLNELEGAKIGHHHL